MQKDAKIELIQEVPLFAHCSKRELAQIASLTDEVEVRAGKQLIHEGELGREFFVLLDGTVEVRKGTRKVRTMGPGEFFGEIALVARNSRRTATVTALTPLQALVITDRAFRQLLERAPKIQLKVLRALAERLIAGETTTPP